MIRKTYSDDHGIMSEAHKVHKQVTHHTLGLSPSKNYWMWAQPLTNLAPQPDKEQLWSNSAYSIAESVNRLSMWEDDVSYWMDVQGVDRPSKLNMDQIDARTQKRLNDTITNPIAVYDIETGRLLWSNDYYYDESKMQGHGYGVNYQKMDPDVRTRNKFTISSNGSTPIVIIPAEGDGVLQSYDRVVVAAHTVPTAMKAKSHGLRVQIHSIVYSSSTQYKIFRKDDVQIKAAQFLLSEDHSLDTIVRTVIQKDHLDSVIGHLMNGDDEQDDQQEEEITEDGITVTDVQGEKIPTLICRNDKEIVLAIKRLSAANDFDDMWTTSSPLMKDWDLYKELTQKVKKVSGLRFDESDAKRMFDKLKPYADNFHHAAKWVFLVKDPTGLVLFGIRMHVTPKGFSQQKEHQPSLPPTLRGGGHSRYYLHFNSDDTRQGKVMWDAIDNTNLHFMRRDLVGKGIDILGKGDTSMWEKLKKTGHLAWFIIFQGSQEHENLPGFTGKGQVNDGTSAELQLDPFLDFLKEMFAGDIPAFEREIADADTP